MICRDFSHTICTLNFLHFILLKHFINVVSIFGQRWATEKYRGTGVAKAALHKFKKELGDRKVILVNVAH
jgi:hypothetical protein